VVCDVDPIDRESDSPTKLLASVANIDEIFYRCQLHHRFPVYDLFLLLLSA
jgi:hypothetical protein